MSLPPKLDVPPFLKWAGGKRWLLMSYPGLFPRKYKRYLEPFVGGASIFFGMKPKKAILSDANARLIECYTQMRDDTSKLRQLMERHHKLHCDEYYYAVRSKKFRSPTSRAAQFLYLNRTCWNGLYRVNLKGELNVPRGTKNSVVLEGENFDNYAAGLEGAELYCCDFEETLAKARRGDFVFVDPPYTVKHNYNGFKKYNEKIFSWDDQIRLRDAVVAAGRRGVLILVCNAYHSDVLELYEGVGENHSVERKSLIAGEPVYRAGTSEATFTLNYEVSKPNNMQKAQLDLRV